MKILIIPDVHGREFWRGPTKDLSQWDKVVFLGDYLDPYADEATPKRAFENLKEIIALKEIFKDKVILLWGNHDLPYWCKPYRSRLDYWCRHDYERHKEIETIFIQHNDLFQWAYQYKHFLFTHAGVVNSIAKDLVENKEIKEINAETINTFYSTEENQKELAKVSYYRGGYNDAGSIIWADVREHYGKTPNEYLICLFQIFGHTYLSKYIKMESFAMLDCGGKWFYLEDDILKDSEGNELTNYT